MKTITVIAQVSGTVMQDIVLNDGINMTDDEFISRLSSGDICTTISHGDGNGLVIQILPEFKVIGKVIAMEALDDMEISNFSEESKYEVDLVGDDSDLGEVNDER